MQIKDIMTTSIISVSKNDDLQNVMDLMKKHNISKVPVLDNGHLVGIVTDNVIADKLGSLHTRGVTASRLHASTVMDKQFTPIYPQIDVQDIVATVGQPGLTMLPILENKVLVGVVTKADLLPFVTHHIPISELMTTEVHTIRMDERVVHARHQMLTKDIARLPVVEDGQIQGILSDMEIAFAFADIKRSYPLGQQNNRLRELYVSQVMKKPALVAGKERSAQEAAVIMRHHNIGCLPVVDDSETLCGILTRTDLIRLLHLAQ